MSEVLSQAELDALLGGLTTSSDADTLTSEETDALGEIGNISMGTAATTLNTLLNKTVQITTPRVSLTTMKQLAAEFFAPSVLVHITYKMGVVGENFLILKVDDVRVITDLMMGGDGTGITGEINDMHLSAISEAMNQMIGSSSTSLSEMLGFKIDITPPEAFLETISETDFSKFGIAQDVPLVKTSFDMTIGDLVNSEIMQLLPLDLAKDIVSKMIGKSKSQAPSQVEPPKVASTNMTAPLQMPAAQATVQQQMQQPHSMPQMVQQPAPQMQYRPQQVVNAAPVEFQSFDENMGTMYYNNDIKLIEDVPLEITVELGKTGKRINEILEFGVGTVVELDRLVGEHLDVLANNKKIAKGEVVVVEENYGIRITEIILPNMKEE